MFLLAFISADIISHKFLELRSTLSEKRFSLQIFDAPLINKKTLSTEDFNIWVKAHEYNSNHTKSSGSMEANEAIKILNRCIIKHNLLYYEYLRDGYTSLYKEVVDSKLYVDYSTIPEKLECEGHAHKRLGTILRPKGKEYKGTATSLSGAGKLTEKTINSMQNYYGKAIRSNSNEIYEMKKVSGVILWHCTEFNDNGHRHRYCPGDSWFPYN